MKVEVRCPICDRGYLVDREALAAELPCPGCAHPIRVDIPLSPEPKAPPEPRSVPVSTAGTAPVAARDAAATAPVAASIVERRPAQARAGEEIVCPRCNLHFVQQGRKEAPRDDDSRPTVLVVEDMTYFQEIARDALVTDCNVKTAQSVAEARSALHAGGIDLLVLDLTLDGGDHGLDLLREFPTKPCPILIYTAKDESEMYGDSWEELQNLGADDIVIKGMNVGESLVRKVSALLGLAVED